MITRLLKKLPLVRRLQRTVDAYDLELVSRKQTITDLETKLARAKADLEASRSGRRENLQRRLDEEIAKRNRTWLRSPAALQPAELRRAFDIPNTAPLWQAVHQVLDNQIQDAIDEATAEPSASCTAEHRTFRNGGIDHLRKFQKELLDQQAAAQKADEDLSPEKEKL